MRFQMASEPLCVGATRLTGRPYTCSLYEYFEDSLSETGIVCIRPKTWIQHLHYAYAHSETESV